jgi:hypothetical protein
VTGGVTIVDGAASWVEADAGVLGGDAPAPLKMQLNVSQGGQVLRRAWVGGTLRAPADRVFPLIEGEAGLDGVAQPAVADPQYHAGFYRELAWAGNAEQFLCSWTLSAAYLATMKGEYYRLLARVVSGSAYGWLRCKLYVGSTLIWSGPSVPLDSSHEIQDLGVMQMPPGGVGTSAAISLRMHGRWSSGASGAVGIDYLFFMPVGANWRRWDPVDTNASVGSPDSLIDDRGRPYATSGASEVPAFVATGGMVMAGPALGLAPQFWVLWEQGSGVARADRQLVVRAWVRPRRRSL